MTLPVTKPRSVLAVVMGAPAPVWILIVGVFVNRVGSFFSTFATLFLVDRGFTAAELPLVLVAIGAAGMAGSLGGGWLADRVGHRGSLVTSMTGSAASLALLAVAPSSALVVVAVCLVGFFGQSYVPAASALLVRNSDPVDRVPVFAFFRLALNVGAALGPLIAGLVATRSYTALFLVDAATCAACGLVILLGLRGRGTAPEPVAAQPEPGAPDVPIRGHRGVVLLCLLLFVVASIYAQHMSTMPLQLTEAGSPASFYGLLLALNGFLVIVGELPISSVTRKLPWRVPVVAGIVLMSAGLVVAGLGGVAILVVPAFVVFTIGEMVFAPVANAAVAELSPPGATGRYQGMLATCQSLGFTLGPALGTAVYALSPSGLWWGIAVVTVVVCAGILMIWKVWR
ncbi:MFS transporter [Umezawaea tangerina]|uniref:Sugar phosphate permease n=1 Tax=Umezawaea tangerina TaxID=84725 RepID=A0A2T0TG55_9PSEU|nr:MFS transporter [Umezawaea tangerina]PRY44625.1 sugar phosphate permease [Umezawaea tangerina]